MLLFGVFLENFFETFSAVFESPCDVNSFNISFVIAYLFPWAHGLRSLRDWGYMVAIARGKLQRW